MGTRADSGTGLLSGVECPRPNGDVSVVDADAPTPVCRPQNPES